MGIIVKVYIENNDEEIDIVTLNSEDKKSSSVTITASVIKDYLNKVCLTLCPRSFPYSTFNFIPA